jgi:hypothetical protein
MYRFGSSSGVERCKSIHLNERLVTYYINVDGALCRCACCTSTLVSYCQREEDRVCFTGRTAACKRAPTCMRVSVSLVALGNAVCAALRSTLVDLDDVGVAQFNCMHVDIHSLRHANELHKRVAWQPVQLGCSAAAPPTA